MCNSATNPHPMRPTLTFAIAALLQLSRVSRAQCSMSSACTLLFSLRTPDCAAHDALQTRDLAKLRRVLSRSLWWSRISGAPLRAPTSRDLGSSHARARAAPHPGHTDLRMLTPLHRLPAQALPRVILPDNPSWCRYRRHFPRFSAGA